MTDAVDHPAHYQSDVEPIDAIEAWGLGFCLGNAIKYIARHQRKGHPLEDLKKAQWYLNREILRMEKEKKCSLLAEKKGVRSAAKNAKNSKRRGKNTNMSTSQTSKHCDNTATVRNFARRWRTRTTTSPR